MKRYLYLLFLCAFLPGIISCTPEVIRPTHKVTDHLSPDIVLQQLLVSPALENNIVTATARLSVTYSRGKISRTIALAMKKPAFLRIEAIPVFGTSDFFLSANKETFKIFFPGEKAFYIGQPTRKNVFSFLKINLPANDVVSILLGILPPLSGEEGTIKGYQIEDDLYRIDMYYESMKRQSLWFDTHMGRMVAIEKFSENGGKYYKASFEDFKKTDLCYYPRKIHVEIQPPKPIEMTIIYSDFDISTENDMSLFDIPLPQGISPIFIND